MKIRTLIVDDEPLARERLANWLAEEPELELIGECGDGREAVATIRREKPDLLFLDVQMPELDGFGVLAELEGEHVPVVVFVTAYDQFAVRAFEVHAVDYLLKPFDRERLQMALRHAVTRLQPRPTAAWPAQLTALLEDLKSVSKPTDRIAIKADGRVLFVRFADIDYIEAADNYVKVHAGSDTPLLRETMSAFETRLPARQFVRISRSVIVNVDRIKELQPLFHGEYSVLLRSGAKLTLSRSHRDKLRELGVT